jgi:hypothetical protein
MSRIPQDKDALPLYGSLTGITLPDEQLYVAKGVTLRRGVFDTFSTPMMGFKEPAAGEHTPGPWVAIDGLLLVGHVLPDVSWSRLLLEPRNPLVLPKSNVA